MRIRYFAGAAEAAGTTEEAFDADFAVSGAELVDQLGSDRERLAKILTVATLLVDGEPLHDRNELVPADAEVDVLPPFAGG